MLNDYFVIATLIYLFCMGMVYLIWKRRELNRREYLLLFLVGLSLVWVSPILMKRLSPTGLVLVYTLIPLGAAIVSTQLDKKETAGSKSVRLKSRLASLVAEHTSQPIPNAYEEAVGSQVLTLAEQGLVESDTPNRRLAGQEERAPFEAELELAASAAVVNTEVSAGDDHEINYGLPVMGEVPAVEVIPSEPEFEDVPAVMDEPVSEEEDASEPETVEASEILTEEPEVEDIPVMDEPISEEEAAPEPEAVETSEILTAEPEIEDVPAVMDEPISEEEAAPEPETVEASEILTAEPEVEDVPVVMDEPVSEEEAAPEPETVEASEILTEEPEFEDVPAVMDEPISEEEAAPEPETVEASEILTAEPEVEDVPVVIEEPVSEEEAAPEREAMDATETLMEEPEAEDIPAALEKTISKDDYVLEPITMDEIDDEHVLEPVVMEIAGELEEQLPEQGQVVVKEAVGEDEAVPETAAIKIEELAIDEASGDRETEPPEIAVEEVVMVISEPTQSIASLSDEGTIVPLAKDTETEDTGEVGISAEELPTEVLMILETVDDIVDKSLASLPISDTSELEAPARSEAAVAVDIDNLDDDIETVVTQKVIAPETFNKVDGEERVESLIASEATIEFVTHQVGDIESEIRHNIAEGSLPAGNETELSQEIEAGIMTNPGEQKHVKSARQRMMEEKVNRLLDIGFNAKFASEWPEAINRFEEAMRITDDRALKGMLVRDIANMQLELSDYQAAEQTYQAYLNTDIDQEEKKDITRDLMRIRYIKQELSSHEMPLMPYRKVPRLLQIKVEDMLNRIDITKQVEGSKKRK